LIKIYVYSLKEWAWLQSLSQGLEVCILSFSNIERENGGAGTYSVSIYGHDVIFFAHFPMQFAHCFTCTRYLLSYKCFVCLCQNYDHLFKINEKKAGGSFYLQSKVRLHFALYVSTQLSWIGKNSPLLRHACLHVVT